MNRKELYNRIKTMVPVKSGEDFRKVVRDALHEYTEAIESLDESLKPEKWDSLLHRLNQLCNGINRALDYEYKGLRHSAYAVIKNQLDGYKTKNNEINGLAYEKSTYVVNPGSISYRMRSVPLEDQKKLERKDIFHIPLDKRSSVSTQRYSVPGYPCLYLSHRLFGCWEEMGRPAFGTIMVSAFKATGSYKVLDIRIPSVDAWETNFDHYILFFPLVIASMVQVKSPSDAYKPEYTIPQILTEWIISHNKNKSKSSVQEQDIIGIAYTSAQKNNDFDFPDDSYDNFAIPVYEPLKSKKYCAKLSKLFEITSPTYYDLEVLKQPEFSGSELRSNGKQDEKLDNMNISPFGKMESYLMRYPFSSVSREE